MKKTSKTVGSHGNGNNKVTKHAVRKMGKQDVNLRKRGFLHFQIGLIVAMALVYLGLEASFLVRGETQPINQEDITELVEYHPELANFKIEKPKLVVQKPKVNPNPNKFDIIDDDKNIVDKTEFIQKPKEEGDPNLNVGHVKVAEEDPIPEKIPFILVEEGPIYPGCEDVGKEERLSCFQEKIQRHIQRHFRYPQYEQEAQIEGKVFVAFDIDVDGSISNLRFRSPTEGFEKEARRIMDKLPQMTPGKQRLVPVKVPFNIPIHFRLH